jgi:hypothetical protein
VRLQTVLDCMLYASDLSCDQHVCSLAAVVPHLMYVLAVTNSRLHAWLAPHDCYSMAGLKMRRRSTGVQEFHFLPLNSSFAAAAPESKFTAGTAADTGLPVFICVCGWSDPAHDARHVWGGSFVATATDATSSADASAGDASAASAGDASAGGANTGGGGGASSSSSSSDSVIVEDGHEEPPLQRQEVICHALFACSV